MSAVTLNGEELTDSMISTIQNQEATKKHKKPKHKAPGNLQPADTSINTTLAIDGTSPEDERKHKKKNRDRPSENNDSIIEPSQSDAVRSKKKRHKSKSEEKVQKEAEIEIKEEKEPEIVTTTEEKKKEKKKKRDGASDKTEPEKITTTDEKKREKKKKREKDSDKTDSAAEPSQSNVVENKRKRRKSQMEEELPKESEIEPELAKDPVTELTQESRRKRRKTNQLEEVPKETEERSKEDSVERSKEDSVERSKEDSVERSKADSELNGVKVGNKRILRRSDRIVADNSEMTDEDHQVLLSRLLNILPKGDGLSYSLRLAMVDWDLVRFDNFSVEICQKQFNELVAKIRKSRTLAELIQDAKNRRELVQDAKNGRDGAPAGKKITTKHITRQSAYQLFVKKKVVAYLKKHPGSKREEVAEKYRSKWKLLSDEGKVKYIRRAEDHNTKYQEQVEETCRNDPLYKPPKRLTTLSKEEQKILDRVNGIPPKPPRSGYMLFVEKMQERLMTEMPDLSLMEMTVEIGHQWTALSDRKKERYKRKAEKKKRKYLEFLGEHPEIEAKIQADQRNKNIMKKTVNRIFEGEPAKPPTSGYQLFCKEVIQTLEHIPSRDWMHQASSRWGSFDEETKAEYTEKMKIGMKIYFDELETFKKTLSPEDLRQFEEIHRKPSPKSPKKSLPDPSKVTAGKQTNPTPGANENVTRRRKRPASRKAKKKSCPMVVKLWSKSPIPNSKSGKNNGLAGADDDKEDLSDSESVVFSAFKHSWVTD